MGIYAVQNIVGNQYARVYNKSTHETLRIEGAPIFYLQDFLGRALDSTVNFALLDNLGATETIVANGSGGALALALTNAVEVQFAGMSFSDQCCFQLDKKLIFEARIRFTTDIAGASTAVIGLSNATNADIDAITDSVWFRCDGATGNLIQVEQDDTAHETSKVTTGVTLATNAWAVLRIDLTDYESIKFYVDGVRVATSTTFVNHTDVDQEYQVMIRLDKAANALNLGVMEVDYVKVWQLSR